MLPFSSCLRIVSAAQSVPVTTALASSVGSSCPMSSSVSLPSAPPPVNRSSFSSSVSCIFQPHSHLSSKIVLCNAANWGATVATL